MTKRQKLQILKDCQSADIKVTPAKLAKLEYERRNRRDLDRFIFNSPFRKARAC